MKSEKRQQLITKRVLDPVVKSVAKAFMIDPEKLLEQIRYQPYPEARREVATRLHNLRYSYAAIGRAMNRDHTSIMYMVDNKFRAKKKKSNLEAHHKRNRHARI